MQRSGGEPKQLIRFGRKLFVAVALAAAAATVSAFLWPPGRFEVNNRVKWAVQPLIHWEEWGYDALMALRGPMPSKIDDRIVVVGIEHNDELELKQNWPVPRKVQAAALKNIAADGAKLIVYDILLSGPSKFGASDDKAMDAALKKAGNVVLTMRVEKDLARQRQTAEEPYYDDAIGVDFLSTAKVGLAEVPPDPDDHVVRSMVPAMYFQDELTPTLPVAAYMALNKIEAKDLRIAKDAVYVGSLRVPRTGLTLTDPLYGQEIPFVKIDYPGGVNAFPTDIVTFSQAAKNEFTPGRFKDKIVFIGVTGAQLLKELQEQYPTAYSNLRADQMGAVSRQEVPGVVVQALHFNALLKHTFVRETTFVGIWGMVFLVTLAAVALVRRFSSLLGLLLVLLCGLGVFGFSFVCMKYASLHVPWLIPTATIFASAGGVGWLESGSIKRRWAGYVSPAVLEQILQSEESIGAQRYEASVMFGDIRGFTSFSEKHSPETVVHLLNRHLEKMTRVITRENGTIDKFLGDGILAVFGAPIPFKTSALAAVRAAWEMRDLALQPVIDEKGDAHVLATGFGITTGSFLGGDIGSKQLRNWTIIGDTVNLASRLQGVTGEPDVIIDEPTYELVREHVHVQSLGAVTLKGKSQPVPCFKVVRWSEIPLESYTEPSPVSDAVANTPI